ncbi:Holliday junction resolvase RuvX [Tuberibacillus sp. Marseille-P3662]|uniref:Holliday junction resolvase RuvX n=1 Tax=Tuberibacillus sp. Marseille-P3662 TaxID=1965358 RepID=UPI000A1CDC43|nr:Holliday junction resolvase RuvX [Tuberibacillus sp. Marseille-P3662]
MKIMGLDYGDRTVGVAVSDALGLTAQGIETIRHHPDDQAALFERLKQLIDEHDIYKIIVGLPKNMNNTIGERGEITKDFSETLETTFTVPIELVDERLTTMAAERTLLSADVSRKKRKKVIDKMAAMLILQSYLDRNGVT